MSGYGQPRDRGSWALDGARFYPVGTSRWVPLAAVEPGAPAAGSARQDMGVVEEPVEQRGNGRGVAEELAPVLDRAIRRDQRGGAFVAAHDDLEEILGRGVRQALQPEIVDDQERDGGDVAQVVFAGAGELRVRELSAQITHAVEELGRLFSVLFVKF